MLAVDFPAPPEERYEVSEEGKPSREWVVPAEIVNALRPFALLSEDEVDRRTTERWERPNG